MDALLLLKALLMGIVEGLTEFLPVSSTGHLIIAGELLNFPKDISATFEIFIQLGAIVAVIVFFARDLADLLRRAPRDRNAQRLLLSVAIAFVPAAVVGILFRTAIKGLFNSINVAIAMIVGAIIIFIVEAMNRQPAVTQLENVTWPRALGVGVAQIAALWPGMSRSASTIVGGLLCGLDRVTTVKFSFYLSIPTIVLASLFDLVRSLDTIQSSQIAAFAVGLITSFVVALVVIRWFLRFIGTHTLKPFAWYRLIAGLILIAVALLARPT